MGILPMRRRGVSPLQTTGGIPMYIGMGHMAETAMPRETAFFNGLPAGWRVRTSEPQNTQRSMLNTQAGDAPLGAPSDLSIEH